MRLRSHPVPVEVLVVGLGNPGRQYEGTPHNVGYAVVERLARRHGYPRAKRAYDGRAAAGRIAGRAVAAARADDLHEPLRPQRGGGTARPRRSVSTGCSSCTTTSTCRSAACASPPAGGSGGHNGLKSISGLIGPEYHRLRVGVDRPPSTDPDVVADYVLSPFAESRAEVEALVERAADAVELWVESGLDAAADRLNEVPPG